jgi:hypothetical protein
MSTLARPVLRNYGTSLARGSAIAEFSLGVLFAASSLTRSKRMTFIGYNKIRFNDAFVSILH